MKKEPEINIYMNKTIALATSDAISDILCWIRGFKAGSQNTEFWPLNTEQHLVNLNIAIKEQLEKLEDGNP